MVSEIGNNISNLQLLRATQAFKATSASNTAQADVYNNNGIQKTDEIEDRVEISSLQNKDIKNIPSKSTLSKENILENSYIKEVRQFANNHGMDELTPEDINEGIRYGRSVLINQTI